MLYLAVKRIFELMNLHFLDKWSSGGFVCGFVLFGFGGIERGFCFSWKVLKNKQFHNVELSMSQLIWSEQMGIQIHITDVMWISAHIISCVSVTGH